MLYTVRNIIPKRSRIKSREEKKVVSKLFFSSSSVLLPSLAGASIINSCRSLFQVYSCALFAEEIGIKTMVVMVMSRTDMAHGDGDKGVGDEGVDDKDDGDDDDDARTTKIAW